jgi:predicted DNA binding protein
MSVLAELTIPASEFVLAETLHSVPDIRIEIKRVVAGANEVTPYFWAAEGDLDAFEHALRDDETVRDTLTLEEYPGDDSGADREERFYRVTWELDDRNLLAALEDANAPVLEAASSDDEWEIKLLSPDREALSAFHDYCVTHDIQFQLDRVYHAENPQEEGEYDVTADQQEALTAAFDAGYFDVPRETTLTDLADSLDISQNALSARLRRGHRNLVENTLVHDE